MTIILYNYFYVKYIASYFRHIIEMMKCSDSFQIKLNEVERTSYLKTRMEIMCIIIVA